MITDLVLPDMSGQELVAQVAGASPHTRVLFTSAHLESIAMPPETLIEGPAILQKSFLPSALVNRLRATLDCPMVR